MDLNQFLLLSRLKLLRFALDGFNEQRQTRVHRFLRRQSLSVVLSFLSSRFLFPVGVLSLRTELLLQVALRLVAAALLLAQDALRGAGLLVAGVGGVQVEEVGGEHGLETRVFHVHLQTERGGAKSATGTPEGLYLNLL